MMRIGEKPMSLTNDMLKLKETADEITAAREQKIAAPVTMVESINGSYYEKRTSKSNDVKVVLQHYDFGTPVELKAVLTAMWEEMNKKDMCAFIPVSMVASAKNKPKRGKQEVKQQISAFVYEF